MVLAHDINQGQRTKDIEISQDVKFETLLLKKQTQKGLLRAGFRKPSPIQLHGIPLGKCGFDLLLEAKSGTGKTVVFSVIALEKIDFKRKGLQVIILTPTREIASQICDVIREIGAFYKDLNVQFAMGGLSVEDDIKKFKQNVHVVVASPGRLKHLIQQKYIDTSGVRLIVFDEADKLMKKSFQKDINYIFSVSPLEKQVIMSSATYSENSKTLIDKYVRNVQHICPGNSNVLLGITQMVVLVKHMDTIWPYMNYMALVKLLQKISYKQCIIFCSTRHVVVHLRISLDCDGWPALSLHGSQEQSERLKVFKELQEYKCRILVTTDLAARGIDASNVDFVVNFDISNEYDWETYLHRIGRAGRYGAHALAISIMSTQEQKIFKKNLVSLKDSISLTYFWSGDKVDLDDLESENLEQICEELGSNTKYEDKYDKALNTLSCNKSDKSINLENLCKSVEKSKTLKMYTFVDLIQDYENSLCNLENLVDNDSFQQIKMQQIHVTEYSTLYHNIKDYNTLFQEVMKQLSEPKQNSFNTFVNKIESGCKDKISLNTEIINSTDVSNVCKTNKHNEKSINWKKAIIFTEEHCNGLGKHVENGEKITENIPNANKFDNIVIVKHNTEVAKMEKSSQKNRSAEDTNENMTNTLVANNQKSELRNLEQTSKYAKYSAVIDNHIDNLQTSIKSCKILNKKEENGSIVDNLNKQLVNLKQCTKDINNKNKDDTSFQNLEKKLITNVQETGTNVQNIPNNVDDLENFNENGEGISKNLNQNTNDFSKNEENCGKIQNINANTKETLLSAGLPTSFSSSSKSKCHRTKDTKAKYVKIKSYTYNNNKNKYENQTGSKNVGYNTINKKMNNYYRNQDFKSKSFDECQSDSDHFNENYILWYNQLKLKMKQIEYNTYMNEILKK